MDDFFKSYNHIERIIGDYLPGDAAQSAINELAKVREKLLMSAKDSLNKICKLTQEVEK